MRLEEETQRRLGLYACISAVAGAITGNIYHDPPFAMLLPVALFFMLWPAMLDIEPRNLTVIFAKPGMLAIPLAVNFILSPLVIYWLSRQFLTNASPPLLVGMLLFGMMPCGGMVPAYTRMLRGNVELSLAVTATSLLVSIGLVPIWTDFLIGKTIAVPFVLAVKTIAITILLPMLFSCAVRKVIIRRKGRGTFEKMQTSLKSFSVYGLMLMIFTAFAINVRSLVKEPYIAGRITIVAVSFLLILLACSSLLGRTAGLNSADSIALTVSSTVKNNAVSMSLAALLFGAEATFVNVIAGSIVQLFVMLGFIRLHQWMNARGIAADGDS